MKIGLFLISTDESVSYWGEVGEGHTESNSLVFNAAPGGLRMSYDEGVCVCVLGGGGVTPSQPRIVGSCQGETQFRQS